jgi:hypothetical protein
MCRILVSANQKLLLSHFRSCLDTAAVSTDHQVQWRRIVGRPVGHLYLVETGGRFNQDGRKEIRLETEIAQMLTALADFLDEAKLVVKLTSSVHDSLI